MRLTGVHTFGRARLVLAVKNDNLVHEVGNVTPARIESHRDIQQFFRMSLIMTCCSAYSANALP